MHYPVSITILSDGIIVKARDNRTGTEAIARCPPEDEFDLSIGIAIAIERLNPKHARLKAGDRAKIRKDYPFSYVFPYAAKFVEKTPNR